MNRPPLLIFDSDGVLIDSEVIACGAVADELAAWGLSFDGRAVAERFAGYTDAAIAQAVTAESGVALPHDFPARVQARAVEAFETQLKPMAGMTGLLERDRGQRCVASNAAQHRLERALEIVGLARFFAPGSLFSAEQVPNAKPSPDLHLHAARRMGFAPEDCLVIEDSVTGVAAARAAGIAVVGLLAADHVAPGQEKALRHEGAQAVFSSVEALTAWLER